MSPIILTLLLTASLVTCPLRCSSHDASAAETASVLGDCGGCCEPAQDSSPSQCPNDDCNCVDCICHGALHEDGSVADSILQLGVAHLWVVFDLRPVSVQPVGVGEAFAASLPCRSGLAMRIAHRSLLI